MSDLKRTTVTASGVLPTEMTDEQLGIAPSAEERIKAALTELGLVEVTLTVNAGGLL